MSEVHPSALTKEEFIARAADRYDQYREEHPLVRCVGITKTGKPCEKYAEAGSNLCQWHGGTLDKSQRVAKAELGILPTPKVRRIAITGRMGEILNSITENRENILDATEEIEALMARFQFLMELNADIPHLSKKVLDDYDKWLEIRKGGNSARFAEQTAKLSASIEACRVPLGAGSELYVAAENLRRARETEIRRRTIMRQMMDAGDGAKLIEAMKTCVSAGLATLPTKELQQDFKRAFTAHYRKLFMVPAEPKPSGASHRADSDPVRGT